MKTFGGVSVLLVTPMDREGRVSSQDFVSLLKYVSLPSVRGESISGVTVCGEMGEGFCLTPQDRWEVVRLAKETLGEEKAVIVAIFTLSLREALEQAQGYRKNGADALLVVPAAPFIYSDRVLQKFFQTIFKETGLPILAYLNKMFRQNLPSDSTLRTVYEIPGVIGIKDSTGDPAFMHRLLQERPVGKLMIQTVSPLALAGALAGADGLMTGSSNLVPESLLDIWVFGRSKDAESQLRAKIAQERLNQVVSLYQIGSAGGTKDWVIVKEALAQMEVIRKEARYPALPYEVLSPEDQSKVGRELSKLLGGRMSKEPVHREGVS